MSSSFDDKAYWEEYYSAQLKEISELKPSPFAQYLSEQISLTNKNIIELGCGNGRDSIFFAKKGANVVAIDQCETTTAQLDQLEGISSSSKDFTHLPHSKMPYDIVYSRFTLHSIDAEGENRTLDWAFTNLAANGHFCIEVRTLKDPIFGLGEDKGNNIWYYNDHHRRFVDATDFKQKLKKLGFELKVFVESAGLAVHPSGDPVVLRVIASKP